MSRRTILFAALSILCCGASAYAETLRCQSVNGNLNCAGSGGVSCQTVDGKKVCTSGHGDVVQSFGSDKPSVDDAKPDDEDIDEPKLQQRLEQHDRLGRALLLQRDGSRLHIRTDWLSLDRD